ncbi:endothelin-converting enzyme 2-like [Dermacentor variabilis]|uniref:endothelin-converting enzyme 2-like n=1 Tax=Dermacentor variabilis TaxID=34621 RepID=UPI003F5CB173
MSVVPLPSYVGTPDTTADRKCKLAATSPSDGAVGVASPQQDTSLVYHEGKKARFGVPSLKVVSPLTSTLSSRWVWIVKWAAALCLIVLAAAGILLFALWLMGRASSAEDDLFCESDDCHHHEALIGARLNRSMDPCADFSAFVCSAWMASSVYRSLSTQQDVVGTWSMRFRSLLNAGQLHGEPTSKALGMLQLCKDRPNETATSGIAVLRKFMDERSISWPKQSKPNIRPLGVLLDLDLNWAVALWFHVRFLRKLGGRRRAMIITPTATILNQFRFHSKLVSSGAFFDYWRKHYELLAPPGTLPATETESKRAANLQTFVLQELFEASRTVSAAQILLKSIEKTVTKIPSNEWIASLNKNLRVDPVLTGEDHVIVSHDALLSAIDKITRTYENGEILQNVAWLFLQAVGPIADFSLLAPSQESVRDRNDKASAEREAFCAEQVEWAYRFLVISLYTLTSFSHGERQKIDAGLRVIREAALNKVAGATHLDRLSKQRAQVKLNETVTLLWPAENLIGESSISIMYAGFPYTDTTFAALWLRLHKSFHDLSQNTMYDDALHMPANLALPLLDYDYILNAIRISVQALSAPVFYAQGTRAMFYGGLGFLYATQLVRALDKYGLRINSSGDVTGLWLSSTWQHAVNDVDKCLEGYTTHFPEIPALEISYGALEQALSKSSDSHQRLRDGFTERQQFFVTLCYLMCSRPGAEPTGDCNKAVMNFPPFASEFGCPVNSRMRPAKPCTFFDERA